LVLVSHGFAISQTVDLSNEAAAAEYAGPFDRLLYFQNFSQTASVLAIRPRGRADG
jgi:hypothetical protein